MAVSVQDLIKQKEAITGKKKALYDLQTSIGTITVKLPSAAFLAEARDVTNTNEYGIFHLTVAPDLKDKSLQDAYGCAVPTDIVNKLFLPGEVVSIGNAIMELAGYGKNVDAKVHETVKN